MLQSYEYLRFMQNGFLIRARVSRPIRIYLKISPEKYLFVKLFSILALN